MRPVLPALAISAVGLALLLGAGERQALESYLFAYCVVFTGAIGTVMLVMITNLAGAKWFTSVRPLALRISGVLPALALLIVPILWRARELYPWASPGLLVPELRGIVARKQPWLSLPFFVWRAVFYLAVWIVAAELLRRDSSRHSTRNSALSLIAVAITFTLASFDWVMSLDPAWFSTVYGIYLFAGGVLAALSTLTVLKALRTRIVTMSAAASGRETSTKTATHTHLPPGEPTAIIRRGFSQPNADSSETIALATLIFTFSMFWAYIAFSQYLIVWIADMPAEVGWYQLRTTGPWQRLAILVLSGQFVLPFLLFLSYSLKRRIGAVTAVAAWLVLMHVLDCYWLVMPTFHGGEMRLHYADAAALCLIGGAVIATGMLRPAPAPMKTSAHANAIVPMQS